MTMKDLINKIKIKKGTTYVESKEKFSDVQSNKLPKDLVDFYNLCEELTFFSDSAFPINILPFNEVKQVFPFYAWTDEVIEDRKEEIEILNKEFICEDWYVLADIENGNYIVIDLNEKRLGRCYEGCWETFAEVGNSPIIANSFTELLEKILENDSDEWYWLKDDFKIIGDAYDDI